MMKTWGQYKPGDLVRIVCAENQVVTLCVIEDLGNTLECCRPDLYEAYRYGHSRGIGFKKIHIVEDQEIEQG